MGVDRTARTSDGLDLHVEVDECQGAPVTVVMSHGFTAQLGEFALQREALQGRARVVLYDQRGHGRSPAGGWRHATIDQLGRDLQSVLTEHAPSGPVVVLGHSMGGMAVMSWARQFPAEVGSRVVGAFLLATSAGNLVTGGPVGLMVQLLTRLHLLGLYLTLLRLWSPLLQRVKKPGTRIGRRWIKHYLFGTADANDPVLVSEVQAMLEATSFTTSAAFYPTFLTHDETEALPVLARIPTTVLVGTSDRLTPASHSQSMATALGSQCELVLVPGCGHSVNVTRPGIVDAAITDLLARATAGQRQVG